MAKFKLTYPDGSTPLDPNELEGLIPDYISTQGELNTLEQANIADGFLWSERANLGELLTATFTFTLHQKMFGNVWKWAGKQRGSNKNIGVSKERINQELGVLLQDVAFWIQNNTYPADEIAVRFHQRMVQIHIFPNGNGRHARLMANLLLKKTGQELFTWGAATHPTAIEVEGPAREVYIAALQKADAGDYRPLLEFSKS
jgi:Fic-DOC domain mobile mystery protein B